MDEIHFAPLQGLTDFAYRSAHFQYIGDVDDYYTPYFSIDDCLSMEPVKFTDDLFNRTVPQILPGNMSELKVLFQFISELHYSAININMGCPYPMVIRKGRGASLIQKPNLVAEMVQYISDHSNLAIGLKTRLGIQDEAEIFYLLEQLRPEKIKTMIIHPRTAKQLYNGTASTVMFEHCKLLFPQFDFIYNGDIKTFEDIVKLKKSIQGQHKWMIGRGLLSNPLLGWQIKNECFDITESQIEKRNEFVFKLIGNIEKDSKDDGHALNRVKLQFEYLSSSYPDPKKIFRFIRKSKSLDEVKEFLNENV